MFGLPDPEDLFRRLNKGIAELDYRIRQLGEALEGKAMEPGGSEEFTQHLEEARRLVEKAKQTTECDWCRERLDQISDALSRMAEMEKLSAEFLETKKAIEKLQEK